MKKLLTLILLVATSLLVQQCDLLDGTNADTNNLTIDEAVKLPNAGVPFVYGLDEQMASVLNAYLTTAELATDNYINTQTFFNQNVDGGNYNNVDVSFEGSQSAMTILRENARFGLNTVLANDTASVGTQTEAEMHFYEGYANLLMGEAFTSYPADSVTAPVPPAELFNLAVESFNNAIAIDPSSQAAIGYLIALARTYYNLGDQQNAVQIAQEAINADDNNFVRLVQFDGVNGPTNTLQNALFDRGTFDDLQPLPRLDFLDPKYAQEGDLETSAPIAKIEEAYLILAEANLADGNLPAAQQNMRDILDIIDARNQPEGQSGYTSQTDPLRENFDDSGESRPVLLSLGFEEIPNNAGVIRRPGDDPEFGLVLNRDEELITVPAISGISVTEEDINSVSDPDGDALSLLYRMRQEIFIAEGRRMVDLGIRWPVGETEELNNPNVSDGDVQVTIPSFLQPITETAPAMDLSLSIDDNGNIVHGQNFNDIIVAGRGNQFDN